MRIKKIFYPKFLYLAIFVAMLVLGFFIAKPFLQAIFMGMIFAYFLHPYYRKIGKKIRSQSAAAFLVCIIVLLLLALPMIIVLGAISGEAISIYNDLNGANQSSLTLGSNFQKIVCKNNEWLACRGTNYIVSKLPDQDPDKYIHGIVERITEFFIENTKIFIAKLPSILLNVFVMFFVMYYLLLDGAIVYSTIRGMIPLKESHKDHVFERFHDIISAVFYGNLSVAFVQGVAGMIGFFIFGVDSPILWGFVMMVFALIPYVGTAIVWLPAALNLIFTGYLQSDSSYTLKGILLIIYGILIISTIDNILKPRLIGSKADVHPILVLIGILGGINFFGFTGIILGPAALALIVAFFEIYEEERKDLGGFFEEK